MNAINKDSAEWHCVSTENMDISSLVLSFSVVENGHYQGNVLYLGVLIFVSKQIEKRENEYWPKVFNVEHIVPSNLLAEILQSQFIVVREFNIFYCSVII